MISDKEFETRLNNLEKAVVQMATNGVIQTQTVDKNKSDISATNASVKAVNAEISDTWDLKEVYKDGTYVMCNGELYICLIQNVNSNPSTNPALWEKVNIASELNKLASLIKEAN